MTAPAYREVSTRAARLHDAARTTQAKQLADHDHRLGGSYTPEEIEAGHRQLRAEYGRPDPAADILAPVDEGQ